MPAKPRWLLSIPDAISQLEQLDRTLLTRRDIEHLFGVSKVRAAALMKTFGAEMTGNLRTLPRTKLLRQLKKHRQRGAFRGEEERRARLVAELQKARLTGVRFKVPAETMSAQLANLPEGVSVARGRIEVRFDGAEDALARLYSLAQALGNDYERFEELVGRGAGGGEVVTGMTTEALVPAAAEPVVVTAGGGEIVLPQVIVDAGPAAVGRYLEFFAGGGRWGNSSDGARREASACARSRCSTSPPTSGRTRGPPRPSSSTWPRSACSATGSSSTRSSR